MWLIVAGFEIFNGVIHVIDEVPALSSLLDD